MNRVLVFDTETTGVTIDKKDMLNKNNSYAIQLASFMFDMDKIGDTFQLGKSQPINSLILVLNYGVEVPEPAFAVHGMDQAFQANYGVSPAEVLPLYAELMDKADVIVGHNVEFDIGIMRIAYARAGYEGDPFANRETFCTMKAAKNLVKAPKKRMMHPEDWKFPSLTQTYDFFFSQNFHGAHDAGFDALAAFDIYLALQGKTAIEEVEE